MSKEFHEVANIFPLMQGAEFETPKADIAEMSYDQRSMVAARIVIESKKNQRDRMEQAKKWVLRARSVFLPGNREPCFVCGKYVEVVHAHHIYPLSMQYDNGITAPIHDFIWLCPTHHAAVHIGILNLSSSGSSFRFQDDSPNENDALDNVCAKFVRLLYGN